MTEQQKEDWIGNTEAVIHKTVLSADGEDLYKFSVSENYTMIEADVSINAHATKVMDNIMRLLEEIEIYQILNAIMYDLSSVVILGITNFSNPLLS